MLRWRALFPRKQCQAFNNCLMKQGFLSIHIIVYCWYLTVSKIWKRHSHMLVGFKIPEYTAYTWDTKLIYHSFDWLIDRLIGWYQYLLIFCTKWVSTRMQVDITVFQFCSVQATAHAVLKYWLMIYGWIDWLMVIPHQIISCRIWVSQKCKVK